MNKELLILGNGFDLAAGLKSTYKDFLENRVERSLSYVQTNNDVINVERVDNKLTLEEYNNKLNFQMFNELKQGNASDEIDSYSSTIEDLRKLGLAVWEILLISHYGNSESWQDVESLIAQIVNTSTQDNNTKRNYMAEVSQAIVNQKEPQNFDSLIIYEFSRQKLEKKDIESLVQEKLLKLLFSELEVFQDQFNLYLSREVSSKIIDYTRDAETIFNKFMPSYSQNTEVNVMNFNYTKPISENKYTKKHKIKVRPIRSVHGLLSKRNNLHTIIFGIDNTDIDNARWEYHFTKAFKTINVKKNLQQQTFLDNLELSAIKFYGHSLGSADYGYFYQIFDQVKLLDADNSTHLTFYYSEYPGREPDDILDSQQLAVARLIESYGIRTRDDKKGKTVLAELQNRIEIVKIDPLN